jgi:hypothetical protein
MLVKDGDGTFVDFQWPSFWYLVQSGFAVTVGVAAAGVVLALPMFFVYTALLGAMLRGFTR